MGHRVSRTLSRIAVALFGPAFGAVPAADSTSPAARLFAERCCAMCHDSGQERIPTRAALSERSADAVVKALTFGVMRSQASGLTALEVDGLATFLTGQKPGLGAVAGPESNPCPEPSRSVSPGNHQWNGWGQDTSNARFQSQPGLSMRGVAKARAQVGRWIPYRDGVRTADGGRWAGIRDQCVRASVFARCRIRMHGDWIFDAPASWRTAVSVGRIRPPGSAAGLVAAFFGDDSGAVYA